MRGKSISVRGTTYDALRARADADGTTVGAIVETLAREFLEAHDDAPPAPRTKLIEARARRHG